MKQVAGTGFLTMKNALDAHLDGLFPREGLLLFLKWEMAAAEFKSLTDFIAEVKNYPDVDDDLVREITSISRYVQHWEFPEEPGLAEALPEAIECTLPELIVAVGRAAGQLGHIRNMLVGVNVRLNLLGANAAIEEALRLVSDELASLEGACEEIGNGTGLAPSIPGGEAEGRPSWASPDGAPVSPYEITCLASEARWNDLDFSIAYSDGMCQHSTPPQLVTERIRAREEQLLWEADSREIEEQMRRAMDQACPRCNSAPGEQCRTGAGKGTTMHKARYTAVS
jgi:hypothetical protein